MENPTTRRPEASWTFADIIRIATAFFFEIVKLASAKATVAAELNVEIIKNSWDAATRVQEIKDYEAAGLKYAIIYFVIEGIFFGMFIKTLIPVAPSVERQRWREEREEAEQKWRELREEAEQKWLVEREEAEQKWLEKREEAERKWCRERERQQRRHEEAKKGQGNLGSG